MPEYSFQKKGGRKLLVLFYSMRDAPSIGSEIEHEGETYIRTIERAPNASFDTKYDMRNPKDYAEKTKNKKGTIGEMMDRAAEDSEKRMAKDGEDRIKDRFEMDWSKKRKGKRLKDLNSNQLSIDKIKKDILGE